MAIELDINVRVSVSVWPNLRVSVKLGVIGFQGYFVIDPTNEKTYYIQPKI